MASLRKLCDQYFGTSDFYEILKVDRTSTEKEIKKAYHRVSLLVHPDRVEETKKIEATEKFKILGKVHSILSDKNKRSVYDESGEFDEDNDALFSWLDYWRSLFKPISMKDIENFKNEYVGSSTEENDVKRVYLQSKGKMERVVESVPFADCDQEPRYLEIVRKLIDKGEVPEYKCFFSEPEKKKKLRREKWEKEMLEAESIDHEKLQKSFMENREKREKKMIDFFSSLEEKYCGKKQKRKSIKNDTGGPAKKRRNRK